jgi:prepilin-type processing-associated H-X9-DG protein
MGAVNPAGALNDRARPHARTAEQFQPYASANDINNGIHRSNFMKMDVLRGLAVNFAFGDGHALKNRQGLLLNPIRKATALEQGPNLRRRPAMPGLMVMVMVMAVDMRVPRFMVMVMAMFVFVTMTVTRLMAVAVRVRWRWRWVGLMLVPGVFQMDVEFRPRDLPALLPGDMQMEFVQPQLVQFPLQCGKVQPKIEQRANKHIAADSAEDVEVKDLHRLLRE